MLQPEKAELTTTEPMCSIAPYAEKKRSLYVQQWRPNAAKIIMKNNNSVWTMCVCLAAQCV